MPARLSLDDIFPPAPPHTPRQLNNRRRGNHGDNPVARGEGVGKTSRTVDNLATRWLSIYTLELRGLDQKDIAAALNISPATVCSVVNDERYIEYRERRLSELDAEFVMMKPLAFAALKNGLGSVDENTALRASEQWFKGAGFGGFAKDPTPPSRTTAEDVAAALLATAVQVNVTVNTAGAEGTNREQPPNPLHSSNHSFLLDHGEES